MIDAVIAWMMNCSLHHWIRSTGWAWPTFEILHFIGLSLLLGAMLVIDVRLAGFWRRISTSAVHSLLPWAVIGFGVNLMTGLMFVIADPDRYVWNIGFQIKMLLIVIAGLNAVWFGLKISPVMGTWNPHGDTPAGAKVVAYLSLVCWFGVMLLGRLIPYVGTGAG
jgi:uncharacterized membrane protein